MISKEKKAEIIAAYGRTPEDTGSPEVQIAILTARIAELTDVYKRQALSPSKVIFVAVDDDEHSALVVVPDSQLSLAIGKAGQNARLTAKLTGYKKMCIRDRFIKQV